MTGNVFSIYLYKVLTTTLLCFFYYYYCHKALGALEVSQFESTIMALFEALALCQFTKYNNFIWIQLIFDQKSCFLGPIKQETP